MVPIPYDYVVSSTRLCYTARVTRYNELHSSCNSLHSSLHECRYMAQKTLVRKNGLVRPLVTTSSNGVVRKLVTRCLSELIKTSVGNKLQAQIAAFPHPCLRHCPTSCSHCLCFPMYIPGSWCSQSANARISRLLAQPQQRSGTRSWLLACPPDGSGKGTPLGPGRVCRWEYGPCGLAAKYSKNDGFKRLQSFFTNVLGRQALQ